MFCKKSIWLALSSAVIFGSAFGQLSVTPALPERAWTHKMWLPRFDEKRALAAQGGYDIVFLGDSITHGWETRGAEVWAKNFAEGPYKALNCGFSGDRTEHVLWRLDHGQLADLKPRAFVLMIGTNNTGHRDAETEPPTDTILGIQAILGRLEQSYPGAKVILHPIFPRGATTNDPLRVRNDLVNREIRTFTDGKRVLWCDFNSRLLTPDGVLEKTLARSAPSRRRRLRNLGGGAEAVSRLCARSFPQGAEIGRRPRAHRAAQRSPRRRHAADQGLLAGQPEEEGSATHS